MAARKKETSWAGLKDVDRVIHEPARLTLVTILYAFRSADFLYLLHESGLTKGNLSAHLSKLEEAGYVETSKSFIGKVPHTDCKLTDKGRKAFDNYVEQMRGALGGS